MKITSAIFVKAIMGDDKILKDGTPQVALIGRSNAGKSSVINSLVNQNNLAKTAPFPGRTQKMNIFLINDSFYFIDLPGYGYAKLPEKLRRSLWAMVNWYFFVSNYNQKVILIIDADVGPTKDDLEMMYTLEEHDKDFVVVANKIDKIKSSKYEEQFKKIKELIGVHKVIPYSAKKKIGVNDLLDEISNFVEAAY